jgi:hypothetical protein
MRKLAPFLVCSVVAFYCASSTAATPDQVCPKNVDQLRTMLGGLNETRSNEIRGIVFRRYNGGQVKVLGATPVEIRATWRDGRPRAVAFFLPGVAMTYSRPFHAAFPKGHMECFGENNCTWEPRETIGVSSDLELEAGALSRAELSDARSDNPPEGSAQVRCSY